MGLGLTNCHSNLPGSPAKIEGAPSGSILLAFLR